MSRNARIALGTLGAMLVLVLAAPIAVYAQPQLAGADEALIVLTGSMQPAIDPGDVVLVDHVPIDDVEEGDVVTFHPHPGTQKTYTHRVVEITRDDRGTILTTKGDANEDPDPMQVDDAMLVGRVDHAMPMVGRVVATLDGPLVPLGLVALSILTVGHEIRNLVGTSEPDERHRFPVADQSHRFQVVGRR